MLTGSAQGNVQLSVMCAAALQMTQGENNWLFSVPNEGCSVPDVAQTAVPPKALHSFNQDTQCSATSTNTALFDSARLTQCDTLSVIHSSRTKSPVQDGCFKSRHGRGRISVCLPLLGGRDSSRPVPEARGQRDGDARRQTYGSVNLNNGTPQLSAALTQFMQMSLVDQPVWVRAERGSTCEKACKHSKTLQALNGLDGTLVTVHLELKITSINT